MSAKEKHLFHLKAAKTQTHSWVCLFFLELSRLVAHGWLAQVSQMEWHPHYQSPAELISMAF